MLIYVDPRPFTLKIVLTTKQRLFLTANCRHFSWPISPFIFSHSDIRLSPSLTLVNVYVDLVEFTRIAGTS